MYSHGFEGILHSCFIVLSFLQFALMSSIFMLRLLRPKKLLALECMRECNLPHWRKRGKPSSIIKGRDGGYIKHVIVAQLQGCLMCPSKYGTSIIHHYFCKVKARAIFPNQPLANWGINKIHKYNVIRSFIIAKTSCQVLLAPRSLVQVLM